MSIARESIVIGYEFQWMSNVLVGAQRCGSACMELPNVRRGFHHPQEQIEFWNMMTSP